MPVRFDGHLPTRVRDAWDEVELAKLATDQRIRHERRPRSGRGLEAIARVMRAVGDDPEAKRFFNQAARGNLRVAKKSDARGAGPPKGCASVHAMEKKRPDRPSEHADFGADASFGLADFRARTLLTPYRR